MKSNKKYHVAAILSLYYPLISGQFNTLTRKEVNYNDFKTETQNYPMEKTGEKISNINKKSFGKPLKAIKKSDLKREIDSLKNVINQYSSERVGSKKLTINDNAISMLKGSFREMPEQKAVDRMYYKRRSDKNLSLILKPDFRSKISMPLRSEIFVTSPYGWRLHPIKGNMKMHYGTDLKANYENVYAVLDGIVTESGISGRGGKFIKVRHSDSFVTSYLHLSEVYYRAGEFVKAGFIIARSGNSGNSTGPHLHFAVQDRDNYINPIKFLNDLISADNFVAHHNRYETSEITYSQR